VTPRQTQEFEQFGPPERLECVQRVGFLGFGCESRRTGRSERVVRCFLVIGAVVVRVVGNGSRVRVRVRMVATRMRVVGTTRATRFAVVFVGTFVGRTGSAVPTTGVRIVRTAVGVEQPKSVFGVAG
jgi:hypothetical protein